jgi:hypothetical protein
VAGIFSFLPIFAAFADLTDGWTPDTIHFEVQSPYNLPHSDRYSFDAKTDTFHLWVFRADKPLSKHNTTEPRIEMSFDKYTFGQHQFEADVLVVTNTSHCRVMQIFGGPRSNEEDPEKHASALQLRVNDSKLQRYHYETILSDIYGK